MKNKILNAMLFSIISLITLKANAGIDNSYTIAPKAGDKAQYCIGTEDCYSIPSNEVINVSAKSDVTFLWKDYFEYKMSSSKEGESTQTFYLKYDDNSSEYQANLKDILADCNWVESVCRNSISNNATNRVILNAFHIQKWISPKKDSTKATK